MTSDEMYALFERHGTDKKKFAAFYARWLSITSPKTILEIGVYKGGSMAAFREIFPGAKVYGIELQQKFKSPGVFIGKQQDAAFLSSVIGKIGIPDMVVDDGSHKWSHQRITFEYLFPLLKPGSFYFIEDLETSYIDTWKDCDTPFTEYLKGLIDPLNDRVNSRKLFESNNIESISFGKTICMIERSSCNTS